MKNKNLILWDSACGELNLLSHSAVDFNLTRIFCLSVALFICVVNGGKLRAHPRLSNVFSDHAVLQRGKIVPIWGSAEPGEKVLVRYQNKEAQAVTDSSGRWIVNFADLQVGAPGKIEVVGNSTIEANDVVVGDVWLIAGQSNMEWPLIKAANGKEVVAVADHAWLRHIKIRHRVSSQPESGCDANWVPASPSVAGNFSAVGYFFAKHLYGDGNIPVGLINVSYGGTKIEAWMGSNAIAQAKTGAEINKRWSGVLADYPERQSQFDQDLATWRAAKEAAEKAGEKYLKKPPARPPGPGHTTQPSGLYNGMLSPVMPAAITGVIWYQGESNVDNTTFEYKDLLTSMIADWRVGFSNPILPFFVIQLPNYADPKFSWAGIRSAQAKVAADDPFSRLVVTIDIGDSRDKHPLNKEEVGRRIALVAREYFGAKQPASIMDVIQSVRRVGQYLEIKFNPQAGGIILRAIPSGKIAFEIAGEDAAFKNASVKFDADKFIVESNDVVSPRYVRYLATNDPEVCLFFENGLPVGPFEVEASP